MDNVTVKLAELGDVLADQPLFLRMALEGTTERKVIQFEAVAGERPPAWRSDVWRYGSVTFVAAEIAGDLFAAAVQEGEDHTIEVSGFRATLPTVHQDLNGHRQPSRAEYRSTRLPWPATEYRLTPSDPGNSWLQKPGGFLVGHGCPSFPDYQTAWRAFLSGNFSMYGAQESGTFGLIRVVDAMAWLRRVKITATHLDVQVRGHTATGTTLEINSADLRASKAVGTTGNVRFQLPAGLPEDAWLFLKKGTFLLDYRVLGYRFARGDLAESGVHVELPEDPEGEIQALLAAGEGPSIEYKRALPGDSIESKRKIFKTVAAFANGGAEGHLVFGVDPDEVTITGLDDRDAEDGRDRLGNLIHSIVIPTPDFAVRRYSIDDKALLVVSVQPGNSGPYGLRLGKAAPEFYVRRGASTYPADQNEIRQVARAQQGGVAVSALSWSPRSAGRVD